MDKRKIDLSPSPLSFRDWQVVVAFDFPQKMRSLRKCGQKFGKRADLDRRNFSISSDRITNVFLQENDVSLIFR